ncbi:MAG: hypothetical protein QOK11_3914 [Pseudonocardiales bacterium]|nr:hypothetical protein [Pseudonocardiales bacterium]
MAKHPISLRVVERPLDSPALVNGLLERVDTAVELLFLALRELDAIEGAAESPHLQDRASTASGALDAAVRELRAVAVVLSA